MVKGVNKQIIEINKIPSFKIKAITPYAINVIIINPPANPSIPSLKFMAFVEDKKIKTNKQMYKYFISIRLRKR